MLWRQCRGIRHHRALNVESCGFTQVVVGNSWFLSSNNRDGSEPLVVSQGCQASFLVAGDTMGFFSSFDRVIGMHLYLRRKIHRSFPVVTAILRFVYILQGSQALSRVEARKTSLVSSLKWGGRPHFEMGWRTRAFFRTATRESDLPECCDRKFGVPFKSLTCNQSLC